MDEKESSRIFSEFATYLTGERGLASATREGYLQAAEQFWFQARAEPEKLFLPTGWTPADVDKRAVEAYLGRMRQMRAWKAATAARHLSALRGFFSFLESKGHISRNPVKGLRLPAEARRPALPQGEEEAVRVLFRGSNDSLADSRRLLLVELIYGGGLRPADVFALRSFALAGQIQSLVLEWEARSGEVPLAPAGLARAADYLARRQEALGAAGASVGAEAPLWINSHGRGLSAGALAHQVRRAMEKAGLEGGAGALRQLAARHFSARGADVRSLRTFLGAKRLGSLDRYREVGFQEVAAAFHRAHPQESGE